VAVGGGGIRRTPASNCELLSALIKGKKMRGGAVLRYEGDIRKRGGRGRTESSD
jgi:hypothetical protein